MKKLLALTMGALFLLSACSHDSDVVSQNLSNAADKFEVLRRVVFYNGITGDYMLTIEGYCALGNNDAPGELTVVCRVQDGGTFNESTGGQYKKHFLGLSDNVTYFVEQLNPIASSGDHYKVVFKPSVIIPDIDIQ